MSELYEGIIVQGEDKAVRAAVDVIDSPLSFRLAHLAGSTFGIYRVAARNDEFDMAAVVAVARTLTAQLGKSLAVFYDNSCGLRCATLTTQTQTREFDEDDELWTPIDEAGHPLVGGPRLSPRVLHPGVEYDCVVSAIDAGLREFGADPGVCAEMLKDAMCYA